MLGEHHIMIDKSIRTKIKKYGPKFIFKKIKPFLKADLLFCNLEAIISEKKRTSIYKKSFKAPLESVEALKHAGFNTISMANNHIMEHGKETFLNTRKLLEINKIKTIQNPLIVNKNGVKIAFLSYAKTNDKNPLYERYNLNKVICDIKKIKNKVHHTIVSLHWGDEYVTQPGPEQIKQAYQIIDAGASIILGHHPHVIQPVEIYKNKVIAYSLGNFVFDQKWVEKTNTGAILLCDISKKAIENIRIYKTKINKDFQPEVLDEVMPQRPTILKNYKQIVKKALINKKKKMYLFILKNIFKLHPLTIPALFWTKVTK